MKYLYITIFIFISTIALGQINIKGNIKGEDNTNLENATIQIIGTNLFTQSDENGNFELKDIPKGKIDIAFYLLGYEQKTITQIITNNETNLSVILIEKEQHLEEVVVSAIFNKAQSQTVRKWNIKQWKKCKKMVLLL